jgi:uncharacterized protein
MDYHFLILFIAFFISNAVEAMTGFGGTIIAMTIAANFYPINMLLGVLVPAGFVVCLYIVARYPKAIDLREFSTRILPLAGIGFAVGIAVSDSIEGKTLKIGFGAFVLCLSIFELVRILRNANGGKQTGISLAKGAIWLIAGGIVQGIYGSGGPLIVYYTSKRIEDKTVFRSTLCSLWIVLNIALVTNLALKGNITAETLKMSVALLPSLIIGIIAGEQLHNRINQRAFRIFIFAILIFAGASLLYGALSG